MQGEELIQWLLAAQTPTVRYLTLRKLCSKAEQDGQVQAAKADIGSIGPVPSILRGQGSEGNWRHERSCYTPKYTSTHWSLTLLTELWIDGKDPGFQGGVAFMLQDTAEELEGLLARGTTGWSCFWGNMLRYVVHAGRLDDPRAQQILAYLARDAEEGNFSCTHNDGLPCSWGAARSLWAAAGIAVEMRSAETTAILEKCLRFLLGDHDLVQASYPVRKKVSDLWFRLNFPLFYQADILFILRALEELGELGHPGAHGALDWLKARRKTNGRWRSASPYRRRTWEGLGDSEETDRWVTLQALGVLSRFEAGA